MLEANLQNALSPLVHCQIRKSPLFQRTKKNEGPSHPPISSQEPECSGGQNFISKSDPPRLNPGSPAYYCVILHVFAGSVYICVIFTCVKFSILNLDYSK